MKQICTLENLVYIYNVWMDHKFVVVNYVWMHLGLQLISKEIVIGVNLEVFDKILSCLDKKLNLKLTFSNSDKFEITMSGEHRIKKYEMALIDIDSAILQIPDVNYSADIEMNSMQFKNYVNELSLFGMI